MGFASALFSYPGIALIGIVLSVIMVIVHILIATGVAKDINYLHKRGAQPLFIPGYAWVMATLVLGLWALGIYWVMHHSNLAH